MFVYPTSHRLAANPKVYLWSVKTSCTFWDRVTLFLTHPFVLASLPSYLILFHLTTAVLLVISFFSQSILLSILGALCTPFCPDLRIFSIVSKLLHLPLQTRSPRWFRVKRDYISASVSQRILPIVLYCSQVTFGGLLTNILNRCVVEVVSWLVVYLVPRFLIWTSPLVQHICLCAKVAFKIREDPCHPIPDGRPRMSLRRQNLAIFTFCTHRI